MLRNSADTAIYLSNLIKSYMEKPLFPPLNYIFSSPNIYILQGKNGSGKSTLLQLICGLLSPTDGNITYLVNKKKIRPEKIYSYFSFAAPYIALPEALTVAEYFRWYNKLIQWLPCCTTDRILQEVELDPYRNVYIKNLSSGLLQRVQLAQALYTACPFTLLDEPSTALDKESLLVYQRIMLSLQGKKMFIIASHNEKEYNFLNIDTLYFIPL